MAHAAGIVHRDLKPQNIFLAWDQSGETVPKLLDFGMAKLLGESPVHTVSGTPIGTPLYMSPEQARGEKVDHRSDVYALGVLCHEMLTGQLPFVGDTTVAVLMAHIIQTAPRVSEVCPELSPLFDAPLLRMLDKQPEERPASAGQAVAALRQAAQEAGIALASGPLRLPRPEPLISGEQLRLGGTPDTLLDEGNTTEPDAAAAATASSSARPLWPFALGLLVLGALLGFTVLRSPTTEPTAEPSATAPKPTQKPSSRPSGASEIEAPESAKTRMVTKIAAPAAPASRCVTAMRSPRFQARNGPKGRTISSGAMMAPKVSEKNGAPTEMVRPVRASSSSG